MNRAGIQFAQVLDFLTVHCSQHLISCLNECQDGVRQKISIRIESENDGRGPTGANGLREYEASRCSNMTGDESCPPSSLSRMMMPKYRLAGDAQSLQQLADGSFYGETFIGRQAAERKERPYRWHEMRLQGAS